MTSAELEAELRKQREKEKYEAIVNEYLRVKLLVAESGKLLTHDEVCGITMQLCATRNLFDTSRPW